MGKLNFECKSFCITGILTQPRKEIDEIIIKNNGIVSNTCTAKTDYLVVGEKPGNSKLKDAEKHGTNIITEEELIQLFLK
jgi:DNA ligase (NAD+)